MIRQGHKGRKLGNVEKYLNYHKLQRTGKLLRSLKMHTYYQPDRTQIMMSSSIPSASVHETGKDLYGSGVVLKAGKYVKEDSAKYVGLGPRAIARPFMKPSKKVLGAAKKLLESRFKSNGWHK